MGFTEVEHMKKCAVEVSPRGHNSDIDSDVSPIAGKRIIVCFPTLHQISKISYFLYCTVQGLMASTENLVCVCLEAGMGFSKVDHMQECDDEIRRVLIAYQ